jgi:hypothetical protein
VTNRHHPPSLPEDLGAELSKAAVAAASADTDPLSAVVAYAPPPTDIDQAVVDISLAEQVYSLRMGGFTPSEIAHNLTKQLKRRVTAHEVDALTEQVAAENRSRTSSQVANTFQLDLDRIERAIKAIWPAVCDGNLQAIDRFERLQKRRADMLGLDAPDIRATISLGAPTGGVDYSSLSTEELRTLKALQNKAQTAHAQKVVTARLAPATPNYRSDVVADVLGEDGKD